MRVGTVIGRVTLSIRNPRYVGVRLLLTLPWNTKTFNGWKSYDPAIVVYDQLGGDVGQNIAISEGREAACPFPRPVPVDAFCAALVDEIFYQQTDPHQP